MNADLNKCSEAVIGCAFNVSNTLGSGFLESVYQNALAVEFAAADIRFEEQRKLEISYRRQVIGRFLADFVIENCLIVEVKSVSKLANEHQAQLLNYLKAGDFRLGLLINFGATRVQVKRLANHL